MDYTAQLKKLVQSNVSVWTGEAKARTNFDPSICVNGTLERKPDEDKFRVVVSEGCYCYFEPRNVIEVIVHPAEFRDGSKAVIKIAIDNPPTMIPTTV